MASLRLKFPDKEEPSVLVLAGARVTLGRLPLNTIQIIDKTLSGFHAEFVLEEDHYRLHDRGSTNGTFVNGESVTDFHLREGCKISFGALECEYSPATPAPAEQANVEALPTRSEINAVRQENAELKTKALELEELSKQPAASLAGVAREEHDQVVAARDALQKEKQTAEEEIARLKSELALLQRDRESLKQVAASAQAEFASFRAEPTSEAPTAPKLEAAPATPPPLPAAPLPKPAAPAPLPAQPLPKPSFPLPAAAKLAPKPPGPLPAAPSGLPTSPGGGLRPIAVPGVGGTVKPAPGASPALKPPVRSLPLAPALANKGGTQKLAPEAVPAIKPVPPAGKLPMKPPVKLPLQPTVRLQSGIQPPKPAASGTPADEKTAG